MRPIACASTRPFNENEIVTPVPLIESLEWLREWFTDPAHWIQGKMFENDGKEATDARCMGNAAICSVAKRNYGSAKVLMVDTDKVLEALILHIPKEHYCTYPTGRLNLRATVASFNDSLSTTHADILRVIDAAISTERAKEPQNVHH